MIIFYNMTLSILKSVDYVLFSKAFVVDRVKFMREI